MIFYLKNWGLAEKLPNFFLKSSNPDAPEETKDDINDVTFETSETTEDMVITPDNNTGGIQLNQTKNSHIMHMFQQPVYLILETQLLEKVITTQYLYKRFSARAWRGLLWKVVKVVSDKYLLYYS